MWNRIIVEDCLTFPVNLWWFRVLALCSASAKDCLLTHGINLDYWKAFLEINFLRLIHPEIILKEISLTTCKETEKQSLKQEANIGIAFRQIPWSTNFFNVGNSIPKSCDYLFWFSIGCCVVDQRSADGLKNWSPRDQFVEKIYQNSRCWRRTLLLLWTRSSRISNSRRRSVSKNKAQKEDRFLRGRQIAFMSYDYFRVTGAHDTVLDFAELFSVTLHDDSVQEIRYKIGRSSAVYGQDPVGWYFEKICTNWGYVSLGNSKPYWNCTTWRCIRRYRFPMIKSWKQWWRGV